ncbi:hypothetical protein MHBO_004070 [Bonamia ostreae]|uniref:Uncharacterized protein n=1 Tax=Bonamia ostreae TaxID=126728 RepID=A0ABV2ASA9_9EUKA
MKTLRFPSKKTNRFLTIRKFSSIKNCNKFRNKETKMARVSRNLEALKKLIPIDILEELCETKNVKKCCDVFAK